MRYEVAALDALKAAGATNLAGKPVIDATNPIADAPPANGVLKFFTSLDQTLMESLQSAFPDAHFVKAYNSVGNARMINPQFPGGKATMFICGNDDKAKAIVRGINDQFGWETTDWAWPKLPAPLSRSVCSGASWVSSRTSGRTHSSSYTRGKRSWRATPPSPSSSSPAAIAALGSIFAIS